MALNHSVTVHRGPGAFLADAESFLYASKEFLQLGIAASLARKQADAEADGKPRGEWIVIREPAGGDIAMVAMRTDPRHKALVSHGTDSCTTAMVGALAALEPPPTGLLAPSALSEALVRLNPGWQSTNTAMDRPNQPASSTGAEAGCAAGAGSPHPRYGRALSGGDSHPPIPARFAGSETQRSGCGCRLRSGVAAGCSRALPHRTDLKPER